MPSTYAQNMSTNARFIDTSDGVWRPDRPFDALPTLPPSVEVETRAVLRCCVEARSALAELKQAAALIPHPAVLINTLPLLEAQASSEIENIVTTADRLFRHAQDGGSADPATREALRYGRALRDGNQALERKPLSTSTAEAICSGIKGVEMRVRRTSGTALVNDVAGAVIYTPPEGETRLRDLLANWERFLHDEAGLEPLVRMAVAHYQFEAIHPFTDGNGRTGRVLNSLFLVEQGLLDQPILYLSRYIVNQKRDYYRLLLGVTRDGAWEPWLLYMLRGVEETARWTVDKIAAVRRLAAATVAYLRRAAPKVYSRELVDVIFEQPYCRIANVVERGVAKRETASRYLGVLADVGVLREVVVGRDKLFLNPRLLDLLTRDGNDFPPFPASGGQAPVA